MNSITIRDKRTGDILIKVKYNSKDGRYHTEIRNDVIEGITVSVVGDSNDRVKIA